MLSDKPTTVKALLVTMWISALRSVNKAIKLHFLLLIVLFFKECKV